MYSIVFLMVFAFVTALVVTPLVRDSFLRLGLVDAADGRRKLHVGAIPRVGGVAIAVTYLATFGVWLLTPLQGGELLEKEMDLVWRVLPAAGMVFLLGLVDDLRGLKAWTKRASSVSRKLRNLMYSCEAKMPDRSRGVDSSVKSLKPNIWAPAALMNGQKPAAATWDM